MATAPGTLRARARVHYPESDGKPVGETPRHVKNFRLALDAVEAFFASDPNVYVGGNMFLYFVEGNPRRNACPDLFVVRGVPKLREPERRTYRTWEENGKGPDLIVEFTSRETRREDTDKKLKRYRDILKVSEYFLFDPHAEYLRPPLQGYRLQRGRYVRIKAIDGRLPSAVLGLQLAPASDLLRFWEPKTQRFLPISEELIAERDRADRQRVAAEEELDRVRRELEALRRRLAD